MTDFGLVMVSPEPDEIFGDFAARVMAVATDTGDEAAVRIVTGDIRAQLMVPQRVADNLKRPSDSEPETFTAPKRRGRPRKAQKGG